MENNTTLRIAADLVVAAIAAGEIKSEKRYIDNTATAQAIAEAFATIHEAVVAASSAKT
jgi:cysteine synthase